MLLHWSLHALLPLLPMRKRQQIFVLSIFPTLQNICDYFLIASAANRRLADAIVDEIEERVRLNCNEKPFSIEGREELAWTLIDYGSVVVHIFQPEAREYYRLDNFGATHLELSLILKALMQARLMNLDRVHYPRLCR